VECADKLAEDWKHVRCPECHEGQVVYRRIKCGHEVELELELPEPRRKDVPRCPRCNLTLPHNCVGSIDDFAAARPGNGRVYPEGGI